jgi:hypothetical protein
MSFMTGHELCQAVEEHLATLGYRVFGDSSDGWTWELGDYEPQLPPCDSQGEAAAAALADLVQRTDELLNAAEAVVERWERGDLAAAVRELDLCLKALRDRTDEAVEAETVEIDDSVDGWLLHGDGPTGPWTVGAYLDLDDAHEAALAKARAWVEEGHHVDLEHFALTLTQHKFIHVIGLDASVWIDPLPIKSA